MSPMGQSLAGAAGAVPTVAGQSFAVDFCSEFFSIVFPKSIARVSTLVWETCVGISVVRSSRACVDATYGYIATRVVSLEEQTGPAFIVNFSSRALKLFLGISFRRDATGRHNIGDATYGYIVDTRVVIVEGQIGAADIVTFSSRAILVTKRFLGISFIRDATGRHKNGHNSGRCCGSCCGRCCVRCATKVFTF